MVDWILTHIVEALSAAAIIIVAVFFRETAKDLYIWVMHKVFPPEPNPIQVSSSFRPKNHSPELFRWVKECDVPAKLSEGYSYYRDPEDGAKRFMVPNPSRPHPGKTFYMRKPGND